MLILYLKRSVCHKNERPWLVPFDFYGTNQLEAQLLVSTSVKELCRCTISRYLDLNVKIISIIVHCKVY